MGLRAIMYIDDSICASASESEAEKAKFKTLWYQILIGLLNIMKSQLSPVQVIGFTLDLREGCFSVLNSKLIIICCMQLLPVS